MSVRKVFTILFFASLFIVSLTPTADPDMWWHLKTGQLILQKGIPYVDIFSFTAYGRPWTAHEWLSEVIMWIIYNLGGLSAIILWVALMGFFTFFILYRNCLNGKPYVAGLSVLLAMITATIGWSAGPKLFTYFFAAVFVCILENWRVGRSRHQIFLLPFISLFWVNMHGGYILGPALIFIYIAGGLLERRQGLVPLCAIGAASFFAAALNPQGASIWLYPFLQLTSPAQRLYITEWQSPDFHSLPACVFLGMFGLCIFLILRDKKPVKITQVLIFLGSAAMAFLSMRQIVIFAILNMPLVHEKMVNLFEDSGLKDIVSSEDSKPPAALPVRILNVVLLILALSFTFIYRAEKVMLKENNAVVAKNSPVAAVQFLKNRGLDKKRGYNDYDFGGYLIWRDVPVFIDGRADMYGDDFMKKYFDTFHLKKNWSALLEEYKVDYAILGKDRPLCTLLKESPSWKEIYRDNVARIFIKS